MKKTFFILTMLCTFFISLSVYTDTISKDLQDSLIRLHVLASSDESVDQAVKLKVRDNVLSAVADVPVSETEKFLTIAQDSANEYLRKNNIPYSATAEFGTFSFPQKSYGNITLPAGEYTGVRILLDEGKGRNWWCVMYPPLCVTDKSDTATKELRDNLTDEAYEIITKKPKVRFKVLELLSQVI